MLDKEADWEHGEKDPEKLASLLLLDTLLKIMPPGTAPPDNDTAVLHPIFIRNPEEEKEGNAFVELVVDIATEELLDKIAAC